MLLLQLLLLLVVLLAQHHCHGLVSPAVSTIESLRVTHANILPQLSKLIPPEEKVDAEEGLLDRFLLRFCTCDDPEMALQEAMKWRLSDTGRAICNAAKTAVAEATSLSSPSSTLTTTMTRPPWDNGPVFDKAPYANVIGQYITPENCITTTSRTGQLVYCIRAGSIDDKALMEQVTVDQLVEFFLYVKEVNWRVANLRSTTTLQTILTCNDLAGVKLIGGSADFRTALSTSSKIANVVYPGLAGPTLLLNLPPLLSALVKLFTPLFPEAVKARLKFVQGPLKQVQNLRHIATRSDHPDIRDQFLDQLEAALK